MLIRSRFVDCEKWRADTKLDETVPVWDYPEKEALFKFYPQYYHKTDKVPQPNPIRRSPLLGPLPVCITKNCADSF